MFNFPILISGTTVEFGITVEFPGSSKLEVEGNGTKVEVEVFKRVFSLDVSFKTR